MVFRLIIVTPVPAIITTFLLLLVLLLRILFDQIYDCVGIYIGGE